MESPDAEKGWSRAHLGGATHTCVCVCACVCACVCVCVRVCGPETLQPRTTFPSWSPSPWSPKSHHKWRVKISTSKNGGRSDWSRLVGLFTQDASRRDDRHTTPPMWKLLDAPGVTLASGGSFLLLRAALHNGSLRSFLTCVSVTIGHQYQFGICKRRRRKKEGERGTIYFAD